LNHILRNSFLSAPDLIYELDNVDGLDIESYLNRLDTRDFSDVEIEALDEWVRPATSTDPTESLSGARSKMKTQQRRAEG
jgi:hypothetical protein